MKVRFGGTESFDIDISETGDFLKQCVRSSPEGEPTREGMSTDEAGDRFASDFHAAIARTKQLSSPLVVVAFSLVGGKPPVGCLSMIGVVRSVLRMKHGVLYSSGGLTPC